MGPVSTLFENPAVKILEGRLWEAACKHYLDKHPHDLENDSATLMNKVRVAYQDDVAAKVREAEQQVKTNWREFKHVMTEQLKTAFATVLRMSCVDWYAVEVGQLPHPEVIAVPYQLLKHITIDLLPPFLAKNIDFENVDDAMLEALASYAAEHKFEEVLEEAHRNLEAFEIGDRQSHFVIAEMVKRDAYFLGEDKHHSQVDMVIFCRVGESAANSNRSAREPAVKNWFERGRKNRKNDRRFTGDGWEIEFEELKACATQP